MKLSAIKKNPQATTDNARNSLLTSAWVFSIIRAWERYLYLIVRRAVVSFRAPRNPATAPLNTAQGHASLIDLSRRRRDGGNQWRGRGCQLGIRALPCGRIALTRAARSGKRLLGATLFQMRRGGNYQSRIADLNTLRSQVRIIHSGRAASPPRTSGLDSARIIRIGDDLFSSATILPVCVVISAGATYTRTTLKSLPNIPIFASTWRTVRRFAAHVTAWSMGRSFLTTPLTIAPTARSG